MLDPHDKESADSVEQAVVALYNKALEDPGQRLGPTDLIHEGGASSLQSVLFVSEVERAFKIELSMSDYYATDSLRNLAALIAGRTGDG